MQIYNLIRATTTPYPGCFSFFADKKQHSYTEKVKYLDLDKMTSYLNKVGFTIVNIFGDYNLKGFKAKTSDRLILVAKWVIYY